jgi:hypothetical protein
MRRGVKAIVSGFATGALFVAAAWAGAGVGGVSVPVPGGTGGTPGRTAVEPSGAAVAAAATFSVGAAKVSIEPRADKWQKTGCFSIDDGNVDVVTHALPDPRTGGDSWPDGSPDCVYLGGFDIGPVRPAEDIDDGGVWVRSLAISNGTKTFVYSVIDAVGYFYRYQGGVCTDCGMRDIRDSAALEHGISTNDIVLASTHTHAGPDFYGGWGGIPTWYAEQVRDAFKLSIRNAIAAVTPATIKVGELYLRQRNNERRDHYYSNVDEQAVWLQARRTDNNQSIATMLNYAGHPTIVDARILHADWPGAAARRFEERYGGIGLVFEGGLGNVSVSGAGSGIPGDGCQNIPGETDPDVCSFIRDDAEANRTGAAIVNAVGDDIDSDPASSPISSTDMTADVTAITHPLLTNQGLIRLGQLGLFTREFIPGTPGADGPGAYHWSKDRNPDRPGYLRGCDTASEVQIRTVVGAHRIGELAIFFGPGELFSNITETVKSKRRNNAATMVLGQANDALGYIMQSFEFDNTTSVVTEYGTQTAEYEEVFAIDHCFGDHVLQEMLDRGAALGL